MGDDRRIFRVPEERRGIEVQLAILEELILIRRDLRHMQQQIQDNLDQLRAQVAANTAVDQSAVTLLQGLHQQLEDALAGADTDPSDVIAAIQGISQQLKNDTDALAAAVAANTSAAPAPAEEPAVETPPSEQPPSGDATDPTA
jgi:peptidoglycan hydrolase CwlO-like protein